MPLSGPAIVTAVTVALLFVTCEGVLDTSTYATRQITDTTNIAAVGSGRWRSIDPKVGIAYERCKATARCPRASALHSAEDGSITFSRHVFRNGVRDSAQMFLDFEDWRQGTLGIQATERSQQVLTPTATSAVQPDIVQALLQCGGGAPANSSLNCTDICGRFMERSYGWTVNNASTLQLNCAQILQQVSFFTHPAGAINTFAIPNHPAYPLIDHVFVDHACLVVFDTDALLATFNCSSYNSHANYAPFPSGYQSFKGFVVAAGAGKGVPVAVFYFRSLYLGNSVTLRTRGSRPLVLASKTSIIIDTNIKVEPGTLGGFAGSKGYHVGVSPPLMRIVNATHVSDVSRWMQRLSMTDDAYINDLLNTWGVPPDVLCHGDISARDVPGSACDVGQSVCANGRQRGCKSMAARSVLYQQAHKLLNTLDPTRSTLMSRPAAQFVQGTVMYNGGSYSISIGNVSSCTSERVYGWFPTAVDFASQALHKSSPPLGTSGSLDEATVQALSGINQDSMAQTYVLDRLAGRGSVQGLNGWNDTRTGLFLHYSRSVAVSPWLGANALNQRQECRGPNRNSYMCRDEAQFQRTLQHNMLKAATSPYCGPGCAALQHSHYTVVISSSPVKPVYDVTILADAGQQLTGAAQLSLAFDGTTRVVTFAVDGLPNAIRDGILNVVPELGDVTVVRHPITFQRNSTYPRGKAGFTWRLTWINIDGKGPSVSIQSGTARAIGLVCTVSASSVGGITGGFFTLRWNGATTAPIHVHSTQTELQDALYDAWHGAGAENVAIERRVSPLCNSNQQSNPPSFELYNMLEYTTFPGCTLDASASSMIMLYVTVSTLPSTRFQSPATATGADEIFQERHTNTGVSVSCVSHAPVYAQPWAADPPHAVEAGQSVSVVSLVGRIPPLPHAVIIKYVQTCALNAASCSFALSLPPWQASEAAGESVLSGNSLFYGLQASYGGIGGSFANPGGKTHHDNSYGSADGGYPHGGSGGSSSRHSFTAQYAEATAFFNLYRRVIQAGNQALSDAADIIAIIEASAGGAGGGSLQLVAASDIILGPHAQLSANGAAGVSGAFGSGGGSGGGITLTAEGSCTVEGLLTATGGAGGSSTSNSMASGGGGSGGRILVACQSVNVGANAALNADGGAGGGSIFSWRFPSQSSLAGFLRYYEQPQNASVLSWGNATARFLNQTVVFDGARGTVKTLSAVTTPYSRAAAGAMGTSGSLRVLPIPLTNFQKSAEYTCRIATTYTSDDAGPSSGNLTGRVGAGLFDGVEIIIPPVLHADPVLGDTIYPSFPSNVLHADAYSLVSTAVAHQAVRRAFIDAQSDAVAALAGAPVSTRSTTWWQAQHRRGHFALNRTVSNSVSGIRLFQKPSKPSRITFFAKIAASTFNLSNFDCPTVGKPSPIAAGKAQVGASATVKKPNVSTRVGNAAAGLAVHIALFDNKAGVMAAAPASNAAVLAKRIAANYPWMGTHVNVSSVYGNFSAATRDGKKHCNHAADAATVCSAAGMGAALPFRYGFSGVDGYDLLSADPFVTSKLNAEVMIGLVVKDNNWSTESNYKRLPLLAGKTRPAVRDRWVHVDILINWADNTYGVRIDGVVLERHKSFEGAGVTHIGLFTPSAEAAPEVLFDELYVGDDDTMGFECPVLENARFSKPQKQSSADWNAADVGKPNSLHAVTRHSNHLTDRTRYTNPYRGGLIFGEGAQHDAYVLDLPPLSPRTFDAKDVDCMYYGNFTTGSALTTARQTAAVTTVAAGDIAYTCVNVKTATVLAKRNEAATPGMQPATYSNAQQAAASPQSYVPRQSQVTAKSMYADELQPGKTHYWYSEHDNSFIGTWDTDRWYMFGGVGACLRSEEDQWVNLGIVFHFANMSGPASNGVYTHLLNPEVANDDKTQAAAVLAAQVDAMLAPGYTPALQSNTGPDVPIMDAVANCAAALTSNLISMTACINATSQLLRTQLSNTVGLWRMERPKVKGRSRMQMPSPNRIGTAGYGVTPTGDVLPIATSKYFPNGARAHVNGTYSLAASIRRNVAALSGINYTEFTTPGNTAAFYDMAVDLSQAAAYQQHLTARTMGAYDLADILGYADPISGVSDEVNTYVMWGTAYDAYYVRPGVPALNTTRGPVHRVAVVAISSSPLGPFVFVHCVLPDGNATVDQTIIEKPQQCPNGNCVMRSVFLFRTFYATTRYLLPGAVMQPVWDSVKRTVLRLPYTNRTSSAEPGGSVNPLVFQFPGWYNASDLGLYTHYVALSGEDEQDFGLNYMRANYHAGYDNPKDIYLQQWRREDRPWLMISGQWEETYDYSRNVFILTRNASRVTKYVTNGGARPPWQPHEASYLWPGDQPSATTKRALAQVQSGAMRIEYTPEERYDVLNSVLDKDAPRHYALLGRPPLETRFRDPRDPTNSGWKPASVPAVKAQPYFFNARDGNVMDNPVHPTVADLLIAPWRVAQERRAKYVAVTLLDPSWIFTDMLISTTEGATTEGQPLIEVISDNMALTLPTTANFTASMEFAQLEAAIGFSQRTDSASAYVDTGSNLLIAASVDPAIKAPQPVQPASTFQLDVYGKDAPFFVLPAPDWQDRLWQYNTTFGDRWFDFRNFRDRQRITPPGKEDCTDIHHRAVLQYAECGRILANETNWGDAPSRTTFNNQSRSFARALNTDRYEECLRVHSLLLNAVQGCLTARKPDFDTLQPWQVGSRECVGGGGVCGPPTDSVLCDDGAGSGAVCAVSNDRAAKMQGLGLPYDAAPVPRHPWEAAKETLLPSIRSTAGQPELRELLNLTANASIPDSAVPLMLQQDPILHLVYANATLCNGGPCQYVARQRLNLTQYAALSYRNGVVYLAGVPVPAGSFSVPEALPPVCSTSNDDRVTCDSTDVDFEAGIMRRPIELERDLADEDDREKGNPRTPRQYG